MTDLDKSIHDAINAEERALLQSIGEEPPYLRQLLAIFSGRTGWVSVVMMIAQTVMFIASVWAGWHFFEAADVLSGMKWGLSASVLLLMSLMIKLALWPVIHINRLSSEIRRLEFALMDLKKG
jgi:hypothetical protein